MDRSIGAAVMLPAGERKDLAVLALARSATITDLASEHGVSRKFIYAQAGKARVALDEAFLPASGDNKVLFPRWCRNRPLVEKCRAFARATRVGSWRDLGAATTITQRSTLTLVKLYALQIQRGPPSQDTEGEVQSDELAGV